MAKYAILEKLPNGTSLKLLLTYQTLRMKCTKFDIGWGYTADRSSQTPAPGGGDYSAPQTTRGFKGSYF